MGNKTTFKEKRDKHRVLLLTLSNEYLIIESFAIKSFFFFPKEVREILGFSLDGHSFSEQLKQVKQDILSSIKFVSSAKV